MISTLEHRNRLSTDLELLIDTLEAINGCIERADFASADLELLLEILNFAEMRVALGSVLCLMFVLRPGLTIRTRSFVVFAPTLSSAIDSATSTLLTSSSCIVFSVGYG